MRRTVLEDFGLTRNEIEIFIALVENKLLSATDIASKTGLNRPYVYYAVERLLNKGFISEIQQQGKKKYQAIKIADILALQEVKLHALKEEMNTLQQLEQNEELTVEVFKGKYVIRTIVRKYKELAKPGDEILSIGIQEEIMERTEPIYVKQAVKYNVDNNINERIITSVGAKKLDYASTTIYRHLPKKYMEKTAKLIFPNHVVELFYQNPLYAIIIHSRIYADTARNQFEILWDKAADN